MLEARSFVTSLDPYRKILEQEKAFFSGKYEIHNYIYASNDSTKTLADEFLRLRVIPLNIWEDKPVVVAIKTTELKSIGKNSVIPLKMQFDTEAEGRAYVEANLLDRFHFDFESHCIGWQYFINGTNQKDAEYGIDLEEIEGHYSIEIKAKTVEGLHYLKNLLNLPEPIKGPSVIAVKKLLNR